MRIKGSSGGELYRSLSGTPSSTLSRQIHGWGWRFMLSFYCLFFYDQHFSVSGSHWTSVGFRLDRWSVSFLCKISVWSEKRLPLSWLLAVCCTNFQLSAVCFNIAVFLKVQALSKEVDNIYSSAYRVVKKYPFDDPFSRLFKKWIRRYTWQWNISYCLLIIFLLLTSFSVI